MDTAIQMTMMKMMMKTMMFVGFADWLSRVLVLNARYQEMIARLVSHFFEIRARTGDGADQIVWGECTHVFHMHCLLKWIDTESSKGQCPMDRRPWGESSSTCTTSRGQSMRSTPADGQKRWTEHLIAYQPPQPANQS